MLLSIVNRFYSEIDAFILYNRYQQVAIKE